MIPTIVADFRSKQFFSKSGEVDLFRNLAISIADHSHSIFINETHGAKVCNVNFTSATGKTEVCEIADLLIISSTPRGQLRATFWQAKKQATSKWLSATTGNDQFDFKGQFNQWDLLSRRPKISGVGGFHPPATLLASFDSASIGSFGVFYQQGSLIEVNHSVAEFVACHNPTVKHPTMVINGYLTKYYYSEGEVIARPTLTLFLEALFAHQVGAPLNATVSEHRWLVSYVRSKAAKVFGGNVDLRGLNLFLSDTPPTDLDLNGFSDGLSVLIVNSPDGA